MLLVHTPNILGYTNITILLLSVGLKKNKSLSVSLLNGRIYNQMPMQSLSKLLGTKHRFPPIEG
ncbi:MAG: hypothetical protein WBP33_08490, partial [Saprospiraceae bacterium]